jgi:hypothetical protein
MKKKKLVKEIFLLHKRVGFLQNDIATLIERPESIDANIIRTVYTQRKSMTNAFLFGGDGVEKPVQVFGGGIKTYLNNPTPRK